jgi:predicted aspartyl protease
VGNNTFAYASFSTPIDPSSSNRAHITHTVKVINPKNNKSTTVIMMLDTGATNSYLDGYAVKPLGLNLTSGRPVVLTHISGDVTAYFHTLLFQIGTLKPIPLEVMISDSDTLELGNLLGWNGLLNRMNLEISGRWVKYTELAALGMVNSQAFFRSRV